MTNISDQNTSGRKKERAREMIIRVTAGSVAAAAAARVHLASQQQADMFSRLGPAI